MHRLFVPKQTVAANTLCFDLFNASLSGHLIEVVSILPIASGAAAITGVLANDLFLSRTTAIGTGGTAATVGGTSFTACTFSSNTTTAVPQVLGTAITARLTPTGGATAGHVLCFRSVFGEETNSATYTPAADMVRNGVGDSYHLMVPAGTGILVKAGADNVTTNNIGFDVLFKIVPVLA